MPKVTELTFPLEEQEGRDPRMGSDRGRSDRVDIETVRVSRWTRKRRDPRKGKEGKGGGR